MDRPNILLITWHDAGRWFGCYGNRHVRTPNVDRLAAAGCRFARNFSTCAICSPSRAAIATGRYCQDNGVMYLTNTVNNNRLRETEQHLCRRMKHEHGYSTALFGVQHECAHEHITEIMDPDERFNMHPWPDADVSAAALCNWLSERDAQRPFYAQIGFFEAHISRYLMALEERNYTGTSDDQNGLTQPPYLDDSSGSRRTVAALQGLLHRGDAAIGMILDALDQHGLADDTIVMMCVDHGVGLPRAKTTCYDPGIETAWIIRYPKRIPAGTVVDELSTHVDALPTLFDLADLPVPENVQGVSFAAHAQGHDAGPKRDAVFAHMVENTRSIRTERYKLIRHFREPSHNYQIAHVGERITSARHRNYPATHLELFDLDKDPNEINSVVEDPGYREVLADLDTRLWDFLLDHNDFLVHETVNDEWQEATRRHLVAHCRRQDRPWPETVCARKKQLSQSSGIADPQS